MPERLVDGSVSFSGGMDTSRYPSHIGDNQYHRACNCQLPRSGGGIKTRQGIHHVSIDFQHDSEAQSIYETGHVQAEGWFTDGEKSYLLVAVNGYIFRFKEKLEGTWYAEIVNRGNLRNATTTKGWFTRVPFGSIYNDGQSLPILITAKCTQQADPNNSGINVGRMGVYVQNRFFYVTQDGKNIEFSDFRSPLTRAESIAVNLRGFAVPEDDDKITAIGKQKAMLNYTEGGVLVFSTSDNIYSVDIRGQVSSWELQSANLGKIQESIRGIGASSSYSFEPANTNIYFRSKEYGVCDIRRSQFQFVNSADFGEQSIEAEYWLERDTKWMLDQCYTRSFGPRVLTTIAPEFREDGYVFWNGLMSFHPDHEYTEGARNPRRFEGIITGVRPWAMTAVKSANRSHRLFIHSYDSDGTNRLYQFTDTDYDLNHNGLRIEIEGWVETRGYGFSAELEPKNSLNRFCKLREMDRSAKIKFASRTEFTGEWVDYHEQDVLVGGIKIGDKGQLIPDCIKPQGRDVLSLNEEIFKDNGQMYGILSGGSFYIIQDRFEFKGSVTLDRIVKIATSSTPNLSIVEEVDTYQSVHCYRPDFSYSIATANAKEWGSLTDQLVDEEDYIVNLRDPNIVDGGLPEIIYYNYLRPNGIDLYLQPDGASKYKQPV